MPALSTISALVSSGNAAAAVAVNARVHSAVDAGIRSADACPSVVRSVALNRELGCRNWRIPLASSLSRVVDQEHKVRFCSRFLKCHWRDGGLAVADRVSVVAAAAGQQSQGQAYDGDGRSYLSMWKKAKERYDDEQLQQQRPPGVTQGPSARDKEIQVGREKEFARLLEVPQEERDRVHRLQVIDRAAAALAAAEALLASRPRSPTSANEKKWEEAASRGWGSAKKAGDSIRQSVVVSAEPATAVQSPGPDFWTWSPPPLENGDKSSELHTQPVKATHSELKPVASVLEKDRVIETLDIPFETYSEEKTNSVLPLVFQSRAIPSLPPLQSLTEVKETPVENIEQKAEVPVAVPERDLAAAVVHQDLRKDKTKFATGVSPDGSRWWKETGEEDRGNGVTCIWTITRGVSSEGVVEWEEKFWEACDDFDYKEFGAEKSGRDSFGNVWREFWKETMWQDSKSGLLHIEKSAEKWGKNATDAQWSEKWWEHYDASGRAEKWADKWSQIDPNTPLEPGHGHVWHERWGEEFDGQGGAMKYTDKWAERAEFGAWTKWGDKWDERFDSHGKGMKQGETWWAGGNGERWNRTWGEEHNGTGWVHKYGSSSSGEHWDTHENQETWYEKHPNFGFAHCLENSQELRKIGKRKKRKL